MSGTPTLEDEMLKKMINWLIPRTLKVDKYRSKPYVNMDYDRARVILELKFPEDLKVYHALKDKAKF